ncbi:hypothetical protein F6Y05_37495 [Bacillus megaterium]|nr:hypothetical protein [Priestia megaterium]
MKKIVSILMALVIVVAFTNLIPSSASAATSTVTQKVKYGSGYGIVNRKVMHGSTINTTTYFTANQYGIGINEVTQKVENVSLPMSVKKDGTKIVNKASHGSSEIAKTRGSFSGTTLGYQGVGLLSFDIDLETYIKVKSIDKKK